MNVTSRGARTLLLGNSRRGVMADQFTVDAIAEAKVIAKATITESVISRCRFRADAGFG